QFVEDHGRPEGDLSVPALEGLEQGGLGGATGLPQELRRFLTDHKTVVAELFDGASDFFLGWLCRIRKSREEHHRHPRQTAPAEKVRHGSPRKHFCSAEAGVILLTRSELIPDLDGNSGNDCEGSISRWRHTGLSEA